VRLDGSRSRSRPGRIVDPLTARGIFTPGRLFDLPLAAAGYLSRNHRHATGTIRDHEAPRWPSPACWCRSTSDVWPCSTAGPWRSAGAGWPESDLLLRGTAPAGSSPDLSTVPPGVRALLTDQAPAVVGWQSVGGPWPCPPTDRRVVVSSRPAGRPWCSPERRRAARPALPYRGTLPLPHREQAGPPADRQRSAGGHVEGRAAPRGAAGDG
jgi:hypothetical protein